MSQIIRIGLHDDLKRQRIESACVENNRNPDAQTSEVSLSGKYRLDLDRYRTGEGTWDYSRGLITRIVDTAIVADVKRNYAHFWHCWIEHPNGNEYLLCGEDYQGYSIINLTQGIVGIYLPEAAQQGTGFCWTAVWPSPDRLVLAVHGCFWAAPYEVVFFDFSNPASIPLPDIARMDADDDVVGWESNDTFIARSLVQHRVSDGKWYDDLSAIEKDELDNDVALSRYELRILSWSRATGASKN